MRGQRTIIHTTLLAIAGVVGVLSGQGVTPSSPLVVLTRAGRTPLATTIIGGQEMVALGDLATHFPFTVRDETATNSVRVTYQGRAILLTPDDTLVSVEGRLVSLPAPLTRNGRRSLVPVEFIDRALGLVYEEPIELRRASRLVIVGPLRVPRVSLRYEQLGDDLRVTVDIAPAARYTIVRESERLLVRVEADALDATLPPSPSRGLLTEAAVLDDATIALTLGTQFASYRSSLPSSTPDSSRVLVDLLASAPRVLAVPPPRPLVPDPLPFLSAPRPVISTIVIDPGHGDADVGVRGPTGITVEKDVTLAVARRLKSAIESRFGIRVLLTRDDDRPVGPDERAAYANNSQADLFISLHANGSTQPATRGAEVYYLGLEHYGSKESERSDLEVGALPLFGGGSRNIELVAWDLAQAGHLDQSAALAGIVARHLGQRIDMSPLGVQVGPMRVLVGVNMPAVLVEMGYLTNLEQEQDLASPAYQQRIVEASLNAIDEFRVYLEATRPGDSRQRRAPTPLAR